MSTGNWRSNSVSEVSGAKEMVQSFTCSNFVKPIPVASTLLLQTAVFQPIPSPEPSSKISAPVPDSSAEHRKSRGPYFHQTNPQSSTNSALLPLSETVDALFSAENLAVQGDMLLQLHQLKEHLKEKLEFLFNWV